MHRFLARRESESLSVVRTRRRRGISRRGFAYAEAVYLKMNAGLQTRTSLGRAIVVTPNFDLRNSLFRSNAYLGALCAILESLCGSTWVATEECDLWWLWFQVAFLGGLSPMQPCVPFNSFLPQCYRPRDAEFSFARLICACSHLFLPLKHVCMSF
jgi:hypothetical protein